jgi:hypothetical protein
LFRLVGRTPERVEPLKYGRIGQRRCCGDGLEISNGLVGQLAGLRRRLFQLLQLIDEAGRQRPGLRLVGPDGRDRKWAWIKVAWLAQRLDGFLWLGQVEARRAVEGST